MFVPCAYLNYRFLGVQTVALRCNDRATPELKLIIFIIIIITIITIGIRSNSSGIVVVVVILVVVVRHVVA
jgi:hypothetical protein